MPIGLDAATIRDILVNAGKTDQDHSITSERLILAITTIVLENNEKLLKDLTSHIDRKLSDEIPRALRRHGVRA